MGRRNLALLILCALALQMELPFAHAPEHPAGSEFAWVLGAQPFELQPGSSAHQAAHDPAACPVCQSLHAKLAVPPPATPGRALPELAQALPAPAQRAHACVALSGHPPRAPPLAALSLA